MSVEFFDLDQGYTPQTLFMMKQWCRNLFYSLSQGGVWIVPRSNFTLQRQGNALVAVTPKPWSLTQRVEYEGCEHFFGMSGLTITTGEEIPRPQEGLMFSADDNQEAGA